MTETPPIVAWLNEEAERFDGDDWLPNENETAAKLREAATTIEELMGALDAADDELRDVRSNYSESIRLPDGSIPDDEDREELERLDAIIAVNDAALRKARGA